MLRLESLIALLTIATHVVLLYGRGAGRSSVLVAFALGVGAVAAWFLAPRTGALPAGAHRALPAALAALSLVNVSAATRGAATARGLLVLDAIALAAALLVMGSYLRAVLRTSGGPSAALTALAGVLLLGCAHLVLERMPGARMGYHIATLNKGVIAHPDFDHWFRPGSHVRTFFATNPSGYYDAPAPMRRQWRLNVHNNRDSASLVYSAPSTLRVDIRAAGSGLTWGIQLNEGSLALHADTTYRLAFSARASRPRSIGVGAAEFHPPWEWLGIFRTIPLDTGWTQFDDTLRVFRDDGNARLHFDLGADAASVEIRDVRLTVAGSGAEVIPELLPYSITSRFDRQGCRGPERGHAPSPPVRRLLILGDSYALGYGVREAEMLGAQLEALLNAEKSNPNSATRGPRYEVRTCAVPGWGALQERRFYEASAERLASDLVLLVPTWNDGHAASDERLPDTDSLDSSTSVESLDAFGQEVRRLDAAVRSRKGRLAVVLFRNTPSPSWTPLVEYATTALRSSGVPVIDLGPSLLDSTDWRAHVLYPDGDWHPNALAHRIGARALATALRARGLTP